MKFTVACVALLCISSTWAITAEKKAVDPKDKRETRDGYQSTGHSSHTVQVQPSMGHEDGNAISIGAGYSIGGAKPQFSFGSPGQSYYLAPQSLSSGEGHQKFQLQPISVQPDHTQYISSSDLSQLMSQLSHGLSTGAISYQAAEPSQHSGAQENSGPQYSYGAPQYQQYMVQEVQSNAPSYSVGTKGLSSYGSSGPVLFTPSSASQSHDSQPALQYAPSSGHSFGDSNSLAGLSLGGSGGHSFAGLALGGSGHSFGGSEQSFGAPAHSIVGSGHSGYGLSLGGNGHSFGGSSHSLGNAGLSVGGSGHSFSGPIKSFGGSYVVPSKNSFKPSAFLGASAGESGHGLSGISASYGAPSFGHSFSVGHGLSGAQSFGGSGGHSFGGSLGGFGGNSLKFLAPTYLPSKGLESLASFSSAGHGHSSSPPRTTYGIPSGSYDLSSSSSHSTSSSPQYYISSSKGPSSASFEGAASHRSPLSTSIQGSLNHFSGSKHGFGSRSSLSRPRQAPSKESVGAYSENTYNTIKYSEELKPRV